MATREEVVERIRAAGLGHVQPAIEQAVQDAIRVSSTPPPSTSELGASRIGGTPDLVAGEEWPECDGRPLAFLAQFRMREVAPFDTARVLPSSGTMYFYYDAEEQPWGSEAEGWRVILREDGASLSRREPPSNLPDDCRFKPRGVRLSAEATLPSSDSDAVQALDLDDDEVEAYDEMLSDLGADDPGRHRLLGYPDQIQNPMEDECERESRQGYYSAFPAGGREARMAELAGRVKDWRLLCQIDTDDDAGMMWGDTGRLYFWIREDSLRARRWKEAWLKLQCY